MYGGWGYGGFYPFWGFYHPMFFMGPDWYGYGWYNPYSWYGPMAFNWQYSLVSLVILIIVGLITWLIVRRVTRTTYRDW